MFLAWIVELTVEFIGWAIGAAIMIAVGTAVIVVAIGRGLWMLLTPPPPVPVDDDRRYVSTRR